MLAIVQFDCAATPVVEELIAAGRLPELQALRERGRWVSVDTPADHFPAATYHTLYSGEELGRQGQHYAFQWRAEEQRLDYRTSFPTPTTIWERAAAAGRRAVIIDPYESHLPKREVGTVLSGWQFENVISLERWASPRAAEGAMARLFGRSPLIQEVFGTPSARYLLGLRRKLLAAPDRVAAAATHLIERDRPDLVWVTLLAAHLGGHLLWDLSRVGAHFDDESRRVLDGALAEIYEACDAAIGRIVRSLPEDADLVLVSPMGMGPESSRVDILPAMLSAVLSGRPAEPGGSGILWRVRGAVPTDARAVVSRLAGRRLTQVLTCRLSVLGTDWSRTRAFMLPSDHHGQIRLNVRGRERDGIVDPSEVDALIEEITEGLLSFHEDDGTRSVDRVWRTRDLVSPDLPAAGRLPDLVVSFAPTPLEPDGVARSPRFGKVQRAGVGTGRSGGHTADAWALLVPGRSSIREVERPAVADLAATACELLGLPADDLTGEPLLERAPRAAAAPA